MKLAVLKQTLLFLYCTSLVANSTIIETMVNDPSALIDGKVNVVTGLPCVYRDDVVIQGAEPIRLSRIYIHDTLDGYWKTPGDPCWISVTEEAGYRWIVEEPDECPIIYKQQGKKFSIGGETYIRYTPSNLNKGFSNTSRGELSSRTNLRNHYVLFDEEKVRKEKKPKSVTVHRANGTIRYYKRVHKTENFFILFSEHLPNGNWVLYQYETEERKEETLPKLLSIKTTNPSKTKEYASAIFKYKNLKNRREGFEIIGSDGQKVEYVCGGGKKYLQSHQSRLKTIRSSSQPEKFIHYTQFKNVDKSEEDRLEVLSLPLSRRSRLSYYTKEKEKVAGKTVEMKDDLSDNYDGSKTRTRDFRRGKIKEISAPVGDKHYLYTTHSFIYNETFLTSVYDFEGKKTEYFNDGLSRLRRIDRFSKDGFLQSVDSYAWDYKEGREGNLLAKSLLDENRIVISSVVYTYDLIGNVLEKKFYGNLTGSGISPVLQDYYNHLIENGVEFVTTKYSYTGSRPSLLAKEEHPSGLVKAYTHLEGTDLITSELTQEGNKIKSRKFWKYTDGILTRQIADDGFSHNFADLSGVTYRTIREVVPYSVGSYTGLPEVIYEKYWEGGQECLLSKRVFRYGRAAKVTEEDLYDANERYCYTLHKEYDEKNRLVSETDAIGRRAFYGYDPLGNQIYFVDFSGRMESRAEYDFSNRPCSITKKGDDGAVLKTSYSYNGLHQLLKKIDPQEYSTQYQYDPLDRCTKTELPLIPNENNTLISPIIQKKYDAAGNEVESIDAMGNVTKTSYSAYKKPICITYPDETTDQYVYELDGSLKSHTEPSGVVTTYLNDYLGRVVEKNIFSAQGGGLLSRESFEYKGDLLRSKTDAEGNTTFYSYDGAGRKIKEECQGEITRYIYDPLGRLLKEQNEDIVLITERDLLDRDIEERTETASGDVVRKIGYEYDLAGNKQTVIHHIAGDVHRENLKYDSQNRLIQKTDPLGAIEKTEFNDFFINDYGQKVLQKKHLDPLGLETVETYNSHQLVAQIEKRKEKTLKKEEKTYTANGEVSLQKETVFAPNGSTREVKTRWEYDCRGRLLALIEAEGTEKPKITKHTYTPKGELQTTTKPDGVVLNYGYNDLGFHISLIASDGSVNHQMQYDRLGNLISFDGVTREYDFAGRLLKEKFLDGMTLINEYDLSGRRIYCRIPQAPCVMGYTYHGPDLQFVFRGCSKNGFLYQHRYKNWDLSGNLLEEDLIEDRGSISYAIDPLSRKKQVNSPYFGQEVLEFDPVGNIRKMRTQGKDIEYDYDDLYQLTSESGPFAHRYQFDSLHNRLQKDNEEYEVNERNELISHMEYDQNGNPSACGNTRYTYDALDRLVTVETPEFVETYAYDFLHRRKSKTRISKGGQEEKYFLYDGLNEIGSYGSGGEIEELRVLGHTPYAEIGAAISIELGGKIYVPVHDLQGNLAAITPLDQTDGVTVYRYSAFGEEMREGSTLSPWRFSSKRTDETGLVYYGRRYYAPEFGRWQTPDPSGFTDGMNLYAFVHNNSLIHLDEFGLLTLAVPPFKASIGEDPFENTKRLGAQALDFGRNFSSQCCHEVYDQFMEPVKSELNRYAQYSPYSSQQHSPWNDKQAIDRFFGTNLASFDQNRIGYTEVGIPFGPGSLYSGASKVATVARGALRSSPMRKGAFVVGENLAKTHPVSLLKTSGKNGSSLITPSRNITTSSSERALFNFSHAAGEHMHEAGRMVPVQILDQVIKSPIASVKDPRNASAAMMHYSRMWRNGKLYNIEVLHDGAANKISHFRYAREPMGPLREIPTPPR